MAVKYAVANGNWSDGTTWNDGVVPQINDEVYLDGHVINADIDIALGNGTISSEENPQTLLIGGYLNVTSNRTISANLICGTEEIIHCVSAFNAQTIIIIGNMTTPFVSGKTLVYKTNQGYVVQISGNVTIREGGLFSTGGGSYRIISTIIGNINSVGMGHVFETNYQGTNTTLTIVGDYNTHSNISVGAIKSLTITGNLTLSNIATLSAVTSTFDLNGGIYYINCNILYLFNNIASFIYDNSTLFIKDNSEPRTYPYIILTDAEMNNRQQYPPENVVKEGVEYVWGEKVGTYQAPPESVVLKDYVYDNDEKTGTLVTTNISQQLISRLENCATIETVQQLLVAHLDN